MNKLLFSAFALLIVGVVAAAILAWRAGFSAGLEQAMLNSVSQQTALELMKAERSDRGEPDKARFLVEIQIDNGILALHERSKQGSLKDYQMDILRKAITHRKNHPFGPISEEERAHKVLFDAVANIVRAMK